MRKGVRILLGKGIELAEVNAEPERAVLFPDEHHCIAPWAITGCNAPTSSMSFRCFLTSST